MHGRACIEVRRPHSCRPLGVLTCVLLGCLSACGWLAPLAHGEPSTVGKTSVGKSKEVLAADRKRANRYALPTAGAVSRLSVYLEAGSVTGEQTIEGVLYGDSNGAPGALLGVTSPVTYKTSQPGGWYPLPFPTAVAPLAAHSCLGVLRGPPR